MPQQLIDVLPINKKVLKLTETEIIHDLPSTQIMLVIQ
jgi:hypothetical protein